MNSAKIREFFNNNTYWLSGSKFSKTDNVQLSRIREFVNDNGNLYVNLDKDLLNSDLKSYANYFSLKFFDFNYLAFMITFVLCSMLLVKFFQPIQNFLKRGR